MNAPTYEVIAIAPNGEERVLCRPCGEARARIIYEGRGYGSRRRPRVGEVVVLIRHHGPYVRAYIEAREEV